MEVIITLVIVAVTVWQIMLFVKLWGMTNDVRKIYEKINRIENIIAGIERKERYGYIERKETAIEKPITERIKAKTIHEMYQTR